MNRFLTDESGATVVEYGLIVSMIFLVIVTAMTAFGNNTTALINKVSTTIVAASS